MRPVPVPRSTSSLNGPGPSASTHRLLDLALGDVQRADAVPIGGVRAEIALRGGFALALQGVGPLAIARDHAVGAVDEAENVEREPAAGRAVGDVEIGPAPLAEALDQAGLGQQLQMPADARLALPEDLREVLDAELAGGEQQQDAQARRLGRRLERGDDVIAGERSCHDGLLADGSYKDMFMCQETQIGPHLARFRHVG